MISCRRLEHPSASVTGPEKLHMMCCQAYASPIVDTGVNCTHPDAGSELHTPDGAQKVNCTPCKGELYTPIVWL